MTKREYGEFLDKLCKLFSPDPKFLKNVALRFQENWINNNYKKLL